MHSKLDTFGLLGLARSLSLEPATTPYSCHAIFTGTSVTNCIDKHGLMLTCGHVHSRLHCVTLTEACSCRLELAYLAGNNIEKIDLSVKMQLHWLIMGVVDS